MVRSLAITWDNPRLRQQDFLVGAELHQLGERRPVNAAAHDHGQPFRGAEEINILRDEAHVRGGVEISILDGAFPRLGEIGDVDQIHGRVLYERLHARRAAHILRQNGIQLVAFGVVT